MSKTCEGAVVCQGSFVSGYSRIVVFSTFGEVLWNIVPRHLAACLLKHNWYYLFVSHSWVLSAKYKVIYGALCNLGVFQGVWYFDETWCDRTYSGVVNCCQMSVSHINRSRTKEMIFHWIRHDHERLIPSWCVCFHSVSMYCPASLTFYVGSLN